MQAKRALSSTAKEVAKTKSCKKCENLSHIKRTIRGNEPVCGNQAKNFNEKDYEYKDIAHRCSDYDPVKKKRKVGLKYGNDQHWCATKLK